MSLITIRDQKAAEQIIQTSQFLALHFYADWVLQCRNMNDAMQEMSKMSDFRSVRFVVLPAEELPEISLQYNIAAVPTVILLREGALVDRVEGANPSLLRDKLKAMVGPMGKRDLNVRLKELIHSAPVLLFMKGNSREPRCGFSRQIVELLLGINVEFKTFDILSDQEIREGLKVYSNWPTYPQLYVNGELIGGLDIVKEMIENGELLSKLPRSVSLQDRLKALINAAPVMVFMKGNKEAPRCGFSKQLVEILNQQKINFKTFDILQDDDVRQGLKTFSNWPTYPQLYVKGQLLGGLDIIKEMQESGELASILD